MTGETKRVVAFSLSALVGLLTLVLVSVGRHREPTEDPNLPDLRPPIILGYDPGMLEFAGELANAVDDIHRKLGPRCPVFFIDSDRPEVRVSWLGTKPCGRNLDPPVTADMSTFFCGDGTAHIVARRIPTPTMARIAFAHELGHLLRLAHDDVPGSVMNSPPQYELVPAPELTPKDVAAIKKRLGCP